MFEKKLIRSGDGFRITGKRPNPSGWRDYTGVTLVVRMPNSRTRQFSVKCVVTEGIQGQPQLTFDTREKAENFLEGCISEDWKEYMSVGRTLRDYTCIKIPVTNSSGECFDAWLAESNFPPQDSYEWDDLVRLFPDYFRTRPGFFTESYEEKEVQTGESWKIKTPGTYCYRIKINLPNSRNHTFRWAVSSMTAYGGGPAWQEACFLTKEDAEDFINTHELPEYPYRGETTGPWYAYPARTNLTLIKVPLDDGGEVYLRSEAFPREYDPFINEYDEKGHAWWEDVRERYPNYFKQIRLGFFNEDVNTNFDFFSGKCCESIRRDFTTDEQISDIMENENLSQEEKCKKLFDRDLNHVLEYGKFSFVSPLQHNNPSINPKHECLLSKERNNIRHSTLLVEGNVGEPLDLEESYDYYVKGNPSKYHNVRCPTYHAINWWAYIKDVLEIWEEALGTAPHKLGFFDEELNLTEAYNVQHEIIKRVIIKYVKDNGYIRGGWNGRYPTPSPTVEEINKLLRHESNLEEYMCTPEEYSEFNTWATTVEPEGPQADWMRKCIESWNKTSGLDLQDVKNLVSFVSYRDSNIKFQQRQQARADREAQHQAEVESESNVWAGQIGEEISFVVREAHSNYGMYGTMWTIKDTQGRTYSWGDSKGEATIERGDRITGKIRDLTEFRGIKQTKIWRVKIEHGGRLGFFESVESDWLKTKFNITEQQLRDMCDWQWEHDEEVGDSFYMYCKDELGGDAIINIFFDEVGISEFKNLEESFEYYGEDWCKEWIEGFLDWIQIEYPEVYEEKTSAKLGFFN